MRRGCGERRRPALPVKLPVNDWIWRRTSNGRLRLNYAQIAANSVKEVASDIARRRYLAGCPLIAGKDVTGIKDLTAFH